MSTPQTRTVSQRDSAQPGTQWWRHAVIYQIYPRSFADANGDGIGDLAGIRSKLADLADLGVDAIWLSPFYTSPQNDAGYDVSNLIDVDPIFGTLADFDAMLATAHELGLRVIVDIVPNHTSSEHPWFQAALAAGAGSPERARYIFREGKGADGSLPPNNWESVFGGPAWTRVTEADGTPGQWYLHLFDTSQPDVNWQNDEVHRLYLDAYRFWLDRGVDGFRIDVAHGLVKEEGLPDFTPPDEDAGSMGSGLAEQDLGVNTPAPAPYWAQDGVHTILREWRSLINQYEGDRALCGEAWVEPLAKLALWVRPDELNQTFNFTFLGAGWAPKEHHNVIARSITEFGKVGAPSTWVLSNHDVIRHATRLGIVGEPPQGTGIGPESPEVVDAEAGLRRARAASLAMLALPGSSYLYQGEELGLPEVIDIPDEARQDPTFARTNGEKYGRDGCRVPIPWVHDAPAYGFNATGSSWLPQPDQWAQFSRDVEAADPDSTLNMYRTALRLRREHGLGLGHLEWVDTADDVVAFTNGGLTIVTNFGAEPWQIPTEARVLVSSEPLGTRAVPRDVTVWLVS